MVHAPVEARCSGPQGCGLKCDQRCWYRHRLNPITRAENTAEPRPSVAPFLTHGRHYVSIGLDNLRDRISSNCGELFQKLSGFLDYCSTDNTLLNAGA